MKKNNRKLYGYISTNRSKHNLKIHLILVCKYRKKLLTNKVNDDIKNIIRNIEKTSDFEIIEMETDKDHIHLMIQYLPKIAVSAIVNRIKSVTTYHIWRKNYYFLSKHFWKKKHFGLTDILSVLLEKLVQRQYRNTHKIRANSWGIHPNR